MQQAFFSRKYFDECPKGHYSSYFSLIDFAGFDILCQEFNSFNTLFCALHVRGSNKDTSCVINIDFNTSLSNNPVNGLSSRSYYSSDLIRIDMHCDDSRSIRLKLWSWF